MRPIVQGVALLTPLTVLLLSTTNAQDAFNKPTSAVAKARKGATQSMTPADVEVSAYVAPNPGQGLKITQGQRGLTSLKYNGDELLFKHFGGVDMFAGPKFTKADGTVHTLNEMASVEFDGKTVTQNFSWGNIRARSFADASRLTIYLAVENTSGELLKSLELRLAVLKFPETPTGAVVDVGMWGNGGVIKLGSYPMRAGGKKSPPVVAIQSPVALIHFCCDTNDDDASLGIHFSADGIINRAFPFLAYIEAIPAGATRDLTYSLRFSPDNPVTFAAVSDVLENFEKKYPFTLKWDDRRPIGMMFLATSGVKGDQQKVNPRRWMVFNGGRFDITTPEGKTQFQQGLLKWAEKAVKVHLEAGAQGMVTWDIEGQEQRNATFYGEPHLIGKLAPEMEEEIEVEVIENGKRKIMKMPLVDAYFRKFRDAGLRTGVCLRPQDLKFRPNGDPYQASISGEEAYQDMKEDLEYATKRWGCTLFYIDSTVDYKAKASLDPNLFRRLQQKHPDVLLMPENQTLRYYTCSAPLDSMFHHGVTRTAKRVRELWPQAFTVTMTSGTTVSQAENTHEMRAERRKQMVDGVRRGDILMFAGWYMNPGTQEIMSIYKDAQNDGLAHPSKTP